MTILEVLGTGPLTTVQDLGRPGLAHLGVTGSGAADRRSHTLANRLLGNPEGAATLEITLGGFVARVRGGDVDVAVTGADCRPSADGAGFGIAAVRRIRDGAVISTGTSQSGLRSYLAVRGGIAVDPVLGSRSLDTLSRIGPPPLRPGDILPIGSPPAGFPHPDRAPVATIPGGPVILRVVRGPRDDWFVDPDALARTDWAVSDRGDRVGVRLLGPPLRQRWPDRQLPSEGMTRGAVQVPPGGEPVILGADHPVTGGYPVIGVLRDADNDLAAQLRPGQTVRFRWARPLS